MPFEEQSSIRLVIYNIDGLGCYFNCDNQICTCGLLIYLPD